MEIEQADAVTTLAELYVQGRITHAERIVIRHAILGDDKDDEPVTDVDDKDDAGRDDSAAPESVYRGMTGMGSTGPLRGLRVFTVSLMTFDGEVHPFVLTDLDLRRLVADAVERLPGLEGALPQSFTRDHSGRVRGSATDGELATDSSRDSASSGDLP